MTGLSLFARLFEYPGADYTARVEACAAAHPGEALDRLLAALRPLAPEQIEEMFIQAFDWNPDTTLDIGWHLYGENYERGEFLVKLRSEMRRYGVAESGELPDHLTHALVLAGRMPEEDALHFLRGFVAPALQKILAGLRKSASPFLPLAEALDQALEPRLATAPAAAAPALEGHHD